MKEATTDQCTVCLAEIEPENGGVTGFFGTDRVSFCEWCLSSVTDMVLQMQGLDDEIIEN